MRFNPFTYISSDFLQHTLSQRFEEAFKLMGLQSPITVAKTLIRIMNGGIKELDKEELGLLHYLAFLTLLVLSIPTLILCLPGTLVLFIASRIKNHPTLSEIFRTAAIVLLAAAFLTEIIPLVATVLTTYMTGLAMLMFAAPLVLLTHIGCNLFSTCFADSENPQTAPTTSTHFTAGDTLGYQPSHLEFTGAMENIQSQPISSQVEEPIVPQPPAAISFVLK